MSLVPPAGFGLNIWTYAQRYAWRRGLLKRNSMNEERLHVRATVMLALSEGKCVKFKDGAIRRLWLDELQFWEGRKWVPSTDSTNDWCLPAEVVPSPELAKLAKIDAERDRELIVDVLRTIVNYIGEMPSTSACAVRYEEIAKAFAKLGDLE